MSAGFTLHPFEAQASTSRT